MSKQNKIKIILVGYKSFIQSNLFRYLKKQFSITKVKFKDLKKKNISKYDYVINCSNSKKFFDKAYSKKNDRNFIIANFINNTECKLILLSSRQVYKQKLFISEKSKLNPINQYAKNCLKSEMNCKKILKNNLMILRLSNVFGFENGAKKKPSLVSLILNGLKQKKIVFDNNYYLYKDFLPVRFLCLYIGKLININYKGIVNVGSGIPFLVKDFINEIIDLKKIKIKIRIHKMFTDKSYCFDVTKIKKMTGIKVSKANLLSNLKNLRSMIN